VDTHLGLPVVFTATAGQHTIPTDDLQEVEEEDAITGISKQVLDLQSTGTGGKERKRKGGGFYN